MELIWTCHQGNHLHISGYVHPPTEERHWKTLELIGEENVITVKGLEGGVDLSISRSSTIGQYKNQNGTRKVLNPKDYEYSGKDVTWNNIEEWKKFAMQALNGDGPLTKALEWNAGIYFFYSGLSTDIEKGIHKVKEIIHSKLALQQLEKLIIWREENIDS
tara:strand:- start:1313 stop:1795 length:483 start_codon:yes stop_codon:yes gene_type:complete